MLGAASLSVAADKIPPYLRYQYNRCDALPGDAALRLAMRFEALRGGARRGVEDFYAAALTPKCVDRIS